MQSNLVEKKQSFYSFIRKFQWETHGWAQ